MNTIAKVSLAIFGLIFSQMWQRHFLKKIVNRSNTKKRWEAEWDKVVHLLNNAIEDVNKAEHDETVLGRAYTAITRLNHLETLMMQAEDEKIIPVKYVRELSLNIDDTRRQVLSLIQKIEYGTSEIEENFEIDYDDLFDL